MARPETAEQIVVFETWYENGRNTLQTATKLDIKRATLISWIERHAWTERADKRDLAVARKAEADAIARRTKLIEDQRKLGQALANAGAAYLQQEGRKSAKSMKDAVTAINSGIAMQRQAEGLPEWVGQIVGASDDELRDKYAELLRRAQADNSDPGRSAETRDTVTE